MRISAALVAWLLFTRPAFALLCGSFLNPMSVSATNLSFGNYVPSGTSTANTTVTIKCALGLDLLPDFHVRLSAGNAVNASDRYLKLGAGQLFYNIYADSGFGSVWGNGGGGTVEQVYDGLLSIGTINFTGFGRVAAGQYVPAGAYTDRITVTVVF